MCEQPHISQEMFLAWETVQASKQTWYVSEIERSSQDVQHIHTQSCVPRACVILVTYYEWNPLSAKTVSQP